MMMNYFHSLRVRFLVLVLSLVQHQHPLVAAQHPLQRPGSPARHISSFVLEEVIDVEGQHHRLAERNKPRRLATTTPSFANERDKVRTLAMMNRLVYPPTDFSEYADDLAEVYAGDFQYQGFGADAAERMRSQTLRNAEQLNKFAKGNSNSIWAEKFEPKTGSSIGTGTDKAYLRRTGFGPVSDQCHVRCTIHVTVCLTKT